MQSNTSALAPTWACFLWSSRANRCSCCTALCQAPIASIRVSLEYTKESSHLPCLLNCRRRAKDGCGGRCLGKDACKALPVSEGIRKDGHVTEIRPPSTRILVQALLLARGFGLAPASPAPGPPAPWPQATPSPAPFLCAAKEKNKNASDFKPACDATIVVSSSSAIFQDLHCNRICSSL